MLLALAAIITSLGSLVGVIFSNVIALRNSHKIDAVHTSTNGKMDALLEEVREASFAKGVKSETDKETAKANDKPSNSDPVV